MYTEVGGGFVKMLGEALAESRLEDSRGAEGCARVERIELSDAHPGEVPLLGWE